MFWMGQRSVQRVCRGNCDIQQVMLRVVLALRLVLGFLAHAHGSADVRLLDAAGGFSNVGLLQVRMDTDFGSVCGANAAAADVSRAF